MDRLTTLLLAFALAASPMLAQNGSGEHESHHVANNPPANAATPQPGGAGSQDGMGPMTSTPAKEVYPELIKIPELTPERRAEIEKLAHERMQEGFELMRDGLDALTRSASTDDFAAMQAASAKMRDGLARLESGIAGHRAVREGQAPRSVALDWFKHELNLEPPAKDLKDSGPMGVSWFLWGSLIGLGLFAFAVTGMYFVKMRRAARLAADLTGEKPASGSPAASSPAAKPAESPKAAPVAVRARAEAAPISATTLEKRWAGQLRIAAIFQETPEIRTYRLMAPSGGALPFNYKPGQFLTLVVTVGGKQVKRCYTISSSPLQGSYCEITVKREQNGTVSKHLADVVQAGDLLDIEAPSGSFTFTGAEAAAIVLIGGGVGATPLMSVIRYLTDISWKGEIHLLYSCRHVENFVFREDLERLQRRFPNLHVLATVTRADGAAWLGPRGHLTKQLIEAEVPEIASRRVHLCGPTPMMEAMKVTLAELHVPPSQIKTENFGPPPPPVTEAKLSPAIETGLPNVEFTLSNKSVVPAKGQTVLEAAESAGVAIDNTCRVGTCGTCRVKLISGKVSMAVQDALTEEDKAQGKILACQAMPQSDVRVEA